MTGVICSLCALHSITRGAGPQGWWRCCCKPGVRPCKEHAPRTSRTGSSTQWQGGASSLASLFAQPDSHAGHSNIPVAMSRRLPRAYSMEQVARRCAHVLNPVQVPSTDGPLYGTVKPSAGLVQHPRPATA